MWLSSTSPDPTPREAVERVEALAVQTDVTRKADAQAVAGASKNASGIDIPVNNAVTDIGV